MVNYPEHQCRDRDGTLVLDYDKWVNGDFPPVDPIIVTCGSCHRSWCERCDPAPSALCPWDNGRGYSTAPVPPRQRKGNER